MGLSGARFVLSADDDEDAHLLMRRAFAKAGAKATLVQVDDGQEVLAYLKGEGQFSDRNKYPIPDLLLLDLKMPRLSGFDVLKFLSENSQLRPFPIIVFSSSNTPGDIEKARALGSNSYLVKPADFTSLIELVKKVEAEYLQGGAAANFQASAPALQSTSEEPPAAERPQARSSSAGKGESTNASTDFVNSPEIFSVLVQQVKDYAIFVLDREGQVRSWNEGARRIHGYERAEILGKSFAVFYPRSDLDAEKPEFELRMAKEMGRYEDEGWRIRKDGSRFWANVIVTPLRDRAGNINGFAKVTRDLTQRKLQEEHLQRLLESEERFRLLVEQVKDYAIFFLDAKGNISSWNQGARRIKGYTADEIIGRHFSTFYTPEDLADEKPARELTIAVREGRYEEEGWRVKKDGSRFWASVVITALWDKRGNLSGFAKVTRDLTARKREEEALRAKTTELEAFAHTLSHDLRAPLRSISSFAEVLLEERGQLSTEEQEVYLQKIYKAANSMETLIRDILKLSQISLAPAAEELVSLEEIIAESCRFLEADIQRSKGQIDIQSPLPLIRANRTLIFQIFSNLLANALKFTLPGQPPRISVFHERREFTCDIHVKDCGPGVPTHVQKSIFSIFDRGAAGGTLAAGTGIGLAIVKKAAERLGGNVVVSSREGEGSDFIVTLPCEVEASVPVSG